MTVQAMHKYRPRGNCRTLLGARDSEVLLSGPAGTGKSRACLEKLHLLALMNPGMRGLICRKTATSLSSTALATWNKFVVPEATLNGVVKYYGGSAAEPAAYRYKNGSQILVGGLDKVSKIMSSEYDVVYVQEATELTENDWESITTRLRNWKISFQQIIADCNPAHPTHWLNLRCQAGHTRMLETKHEDNPLLFDADGTLTEKGADYIGKLDKLTGVRKLRLRYGRWAAAEGIIYADFAQAHVIDRIAPQPAALSEYAASSSGAAPVDQFGVPWSWDRYWAVDFGYTNPFVLQCWAVDPDDRLYLYREIYHTQRTVDQHATAIMMIVAPDGQWLEPQPTAVYCDHDAEGRAVLERELGISTEAAHKSVLEGIDATQVRMRISGDGLPRIFFLRDALVEMDEELKESGKPTCTLEEIPGYVWTDKQKEAPDKKDDHGCDAMRYVVAGRDFGIRAIFRSFSA
jgi:Phage terminase large subunit